MKFTLTFLVVISIQFSSISQRKNDNWVENLQDGDSLRIELLSSGCFHTKQGTVIVYKVNDEIFATDLSDTIVKLDSSGMENLRVFQSELGKQRRWGCTTTDYYKVYLNDKRVKKTQDGSCGWRGYWSYVSVLFEERASQ